MPGGSVTSAMLPSQLVRHTMAPRTAGHLNLTPEGMASWLGGACQRCLSCMLQSKTSMTALMLLLKLSHSSNRWHHRVVPCESRPQGHLPTAQESLLPCRFLEQIINNPSQTLEVDADFMDDLQQALIDRLSDRLPAVRATAARALARMADPGEVSSVQQWEHG